MTQKSVFKFLVVCCMCLFLADIALGTPMLPSDCQIRRVTFARDKIF